MKYDLIVVGGGPAGLMAAKTAAEDGLSVVLIERKREITEINRACSQIFYTNKLDPVPPSKDAHLEPVSAECLKEKTRFHFPVQGFSIDYSGPLRPYLNWIHLSPGGYQLNRYKWNDRPWGFYYDKETFLAGLLDSVEKAKVDVRSETICLGAENTKDGVEVKVHVGSSEHTISARTVIDAEGITSKIVSSIDLNKTRKVLMQGGIRWVQYVMEGVETGLPESSWLTWSVPSINHGWNITIGLSADNRHTVGTAAVNPAMVLNKFIDHPKYAHMFRNARIVKKEAFSSAVLSPITEPIVGNIMIVGDAAAEGANCFIQGAVACGYQAVKAIEKEFNGKKGYEEYIAWWQQAFGFNVNILESIKMLPGRVYGLTRICSDEEIDYIYSLFQGKIGVPSQVLNDNSDLIQKGNPDLFEKLGLKRE